MKITGKEILEKNNLENAELYKNYELLKPMDIKDENNRYVKVKNIILKKAVEYIIKTENYKDLKVADKHTFIMSDYSQKHADELKVGDELKNINGPVKVTEIINTGIEGDMIDLEVASFTHLYSDYQGFVHHNSFGVDKQLTSMFGPEQGGKNKNWAIFKGKVSLTAVYKTLFQNNGKIIVFDDADSVFASEDATNLLKAALDTKAARYISYKVKSPEFFDPHKPPYVYDNTVLFPSYAKSLKAASLMYKRENQVKGALEPDEVENIETELKVNEETRYQLLVNLDKLPNVFEFTGSCIFISNRKLSQIDAAIRDRSIAPIELDMSNEQVIDRIEHLLPYLKPGDDGDNIEDLTLSEKQEVLDWYREIMLKYNRQNLSLRTFKTAMVYYKMDSKTWKDLVSYYVGI